MNSNEIDLSKVYSEGRRYELITPTGEALMAACLSWQQDQPNYAGEYAQPTQCAHNISKVFSLAGLAAYNSSGVQELLKQVEDKKGLYFPLDKQPNDILKKISDLFGGKLPTGTLVAGFQNQDMSGEGSDGHVAMIGDITKSGALKLYHNNWYRPTCNDGSTTGPCNTGWKMEQWVENMIPKDWLNTKDKNQNYYQRRFMPTPWIDILRQPPYIGTPSSLHIELPDIDDLDPTNDFVFIAIPVEILNELSNKQYRILDSSGKQSTGTTTLKIPT